MTNSDDVGSVAQSNPDAAHSFRALVDRLEIEGGEVVVATLASIRDGARWRLCFGSIVVCPREAARLSWPEWLALDEPNTEIIVNALQTAGAPASQWHIFDVVHENWRYVRRVMAADTLGEDLDRAVKQQLIDVPGSPEPIAIGLQPADALFRVFPSSDTPANQLLYCIGRPAMGWLHPIVLPSNVGVAVSDIATLPSDGPLQASLVPASTLSLMGMGKSMFGAPIFPALFVGRLQREAWVSRVYGEPPTLGYFNINVRIDPRRVSLDQLQLDLEELDDAGYLLSARRVVFGDLEIPAHGPDQFTVKLPALGGRLKRRLRLYHQDGRLLDSRDDIILAEQIQTTIKINGRASTMTTLGEAPPANLVHRLEALDRADSEFAQMLAEGIPGRLIVQNVNAIAVLNKRLLAARGQLCAADPYFGMGGGTHDWDVFAGLSVPIRVLGDRSMVVPPQPGGAGGVLSARAWAKGKDAPFHDRFYVWDGGGIVVGASANGLGDRLATINQVSSAVAAELKRHFDIWWNDPRFISVA